MALVSSSSFLTGAFRKYPLYKDIIIPLVDWALDSSEVQFQYITGKYLHYQTLDVALAQELIRELGYGYILDAVILDTTDARIIFGYLQLFHQLKGSKEGIQFVLSLLGYEFTEVEWFQNPDTLAFYSRDQLMGETPLPAALATPPYTFIVNLLLNLNQYDAVKIRKIIKFSRFYVYDILRLVINILIDFAHLEQGIGIFIDKTVQTEQLVPTIFANLGIFIDKDIVFTGDPISLPPVPVILFTHDFNSLLDQTIHNNDWLPDNYVPNALFQHNLNDLLDQTSNNNNWLLDSTDVTLLPLFRHNFNNLSDQTVHNNNWLSDSTDVSPTDLLLASLFAWRLQDGSGSNINDSTTNNIDGTLVGTLTSVWQGGLLVGDTSSIRFNGSNNVIQTANNTNSYTEFTVRSVIRFETGDKTAKSFHPLLSKWNTNFVNGFGECWITEYDPPNNKLYLYVYDATDDSVNYNMRYFQATCPTINENQDYIFQIAFKVADVNNSNLNLCEMCVNGVKLVDGFWTNSRVGFTNITAIKNTNIPIEFGAYGASVRDFAKYRASRVYFDSVFLTEAQAYTDAHAIGLV